MNQQPIQNQNPTPDSSPQPPSQLLKARVQKLQRLKSRGIAPYPTASEITLGRLPSEEIKKKFDSLKQGEESERTVRFCGRMLTRRDMGKASFAHLQDQCGTLQIYLRKDHLGEESYLLFNKDLDLGDFLGCEGKIFRTKTNELTLRAEKIVLLAKSLKPLPEKWHGLQDPELRARQRELDLIANPESKKKFLLRSKLIQSLRTALLEEGFVEVETPILQSVAGGAVARAFETYHLALDQKFFLRVAPELYLKRCLVGGLEKVFEIGRVFRNEGMDSLHNPEFTILEAYEAYGNRESMMHLTELLIKKAAQQCGINEFVLKDNRIAVPETFARKTVLELFESFAGKEVAALVAEEDWKALAEKLGETLKLKLAPEFLYKSFDHAFDQWIAPHLLEPTFVTDFPLSLSPLAKRKENSEHIADRFELYIGGEEIANAYSELNDPQEQKERLANWRKERGKSEGGASLAGEGMGTDESFLSALEYGMPPAGGLGIGVDRLVMLFCGERSIREVLLFPTLKPER